MLKLCFTVSKKNWFNPFQRIKHVFSRIRRVTEEGLEHLDFFLLHVGLTSSKNRLSAILVESLRTHFEVLGLNLCLQAQVLGLGLDHFLFLALFCIQQLNFYPFDSVSLANLRFEILWHQKKLTPFDNQIQHRASYSVRKCEFPKFLAEQENAMFDILQLQDILQCHPFMMSRKFKTLNWQWYELKRIKPIFANRENDRTWFGAHLYYRYLK